jgi:hypothetical protein
VSGSASPYFKMQDPSAVPAKQLAGPNNVTASKLHYNGLTNDRS